MNINYFLEQFSFKKKNVKYIVAVAALYLFFLIINIPANVFLSTINLPGNVKLSSISGSIWSGNIRNVDVSGIQLGSVSWDLNPLSLLIGNLSADVHIVNNQQYIQTAVSLSYSGKLDLEETRFVIDLSSLQPLTYGLPISYVGKASGYFPVSYFHKNQYIGINGKLSLGGIEMISPQRQYFGDFTVDFRAEKEGMTSGKLKDTGGELSVDGQVTISKIGQLSLSSKIAARESGSSLDNMLVFFGRKDASGSVQLNSNMKLWH